MTLIRAWDMLRKATDGMEILKSIYINAAFIYDCRSVIIR